MIRRAFIMRLKPEALAEYRRRHASIWPELVAEVERSGIQSITTFVRGDEVIVVSEASDDSAWERLWNSDVHRRWARLLEPLVQSGDDGAVDSSELSELFRIATHATRAAPSETTAAVGVPDMLRESDYVDGVARAAPGARAKAPCTPGGKPKHKMAARGTKKPAPKKHAGETRSPRSKKAKRGIAKSTKWKAATKNPAKKKRAKKKPAGTKVAGKAAKKRAPSKKTPPKKATGQTNGRTTRAKRKKKKPVKNRRPAAAASR